MVHFFQSVDNSIIDIPSLFNPSRFIHRFFFLSQRIGVRGIDKNHINSLVITMTFLTFFCESFLEFLDKDMVVSVNYVMTFFKTMLLLKIKLPMVVISSCFHHNLFQFFNSFGIQVNYVCYFRRICVYVIKFVFLFLGIVNL